MVIDDDVAWKNLTKSVGYHLWDTSSTRVVTVNYNRLQRHCLSERFPNCGFVERGIRAEREPVEFSHRLNLLKARRRVNSGRARRGAGERRARKLEVPLFGDHLTGSAEVGREVLELWQAIADRQHGLSVIHMDAGLERHRRDRRSVNIS